MASAPLPSNEVERLRQLHALALTHMPAEPGFFRAARLAKVLADAERATIAFVDGDRVWFRGQDGDAPKEIARGQALCPHALLSPEVLWVEDASQDPRFHDNPHVTGDQQIRFFAAAPINLPGGTRPGAVCVSDARPRAFDAGVAAALADIAESIGEALELRRVRHNLAEALDEAASANAALEAFIGQAPVALMMLDRDLKVLQVSPRWSAEYRVSEEEVVSRHLYEVLPDSEKFADLHQRVLQGEAFSGDNAPVRRPDGSRRISRWELAPWRDAQGEVGGILVGTADMTASVEAREAAEQSERRLKMALEISDMVVWELSFADRSVTWTGSADGLFDQHLDFDSLTNPYGDQVHPDDRERVAEIARRQEETGEIFRCEYRANRPDGRLVWISSVRELIRDEHGCPAKIIGVMKDVTDRRLHEEEMERAREAAEAANRAKSEFLANMSHEIRTPLNGVMGVAGALARTELAADQREMIELIESSAHTLERLLTDVLDIARIEAGAMELKPEPFDMHRTVHELSSLFAPKAREKGIGFRHRICPAAEGRFVGDLGRLKQVLSNLLSNAVKFTEQGCVEFEVDAAGSPDQPRIRFTVRDTGIGFDAETKARLFQRFEQADGSITRRFGGTGLGLAISKTLAGMMGGTLDAISAPGRGSTFVLTLPFERASETGTESGPTPAADLPSWCEGRAPRILVAEDHPVNRRVVELILGAAGAELVHVENGAQAVEAAAEPFDLILMDVQMPVMDGHTAIRAIRERERRTGCRPVPILALTANALPEHARASREAGADGHVTKPIAAQALMQAVREALDAAAEAPEAMAG